MNSTQIAHVIWMGMQAAMGLHLSVRSTNVSTTQLKTTQSRESAYDTIPCFTRLSALREMRKNNMYSNIGDERRRNLDRLTSLSPVRFVHHRQLPNYRIVLPRGFFVLTSWSAAVENNIVVVIRYRFSNQSIHTSTASKSNGDWQNDGLPRPW